MPSPKDASHLTELFAQAAAVAQAVPEALREIAFKRALDELLGTQPSADPSPDVAGKTVGGQRGQSPPTSDTSRADRLIGLIDRTEAIHIGTSGRVLEKALFILRAAHHHGIKALTPGEIAKVLTDKFRERVSAPAVRMALGSDATYTDRKPEGAGFVYRLMAPGERYLADIEAGEVVVPVRSPTAPRKRGSAKSKGVPTVSADTASPQRKQPAAKRATSRPGPKKMLEELITQGFFNEPRGIGDIIDHVQQKRGHRYKATDLSPALARLLREERLDRDRDDKGQYRYKRSA